MTYQKCKVLGCSSEGNLNGISQTHYKKENCPFIKNRDSISTDLEYDYTEEDCDFKQIYTSEAVTANSKNPASLELCLNIDEQLSEWKEKQHNLESIIDQLNVEREKIQDINSKEHDLKDSEISNLEMEIIHLKSLYKLNK